MRRLILMLIALIAPVLAADPVIDRLRDEARTFANSEQYDKAKPLLRDACLLAKNSGDARLFAQCLLQFGELFDGFHAAKPDLAAKLLKEAAVHAASCGDYELEFAIHNALHFVLDDEKAQAEADTQALDCALALGDAALFGRTFVEADRVEPCIELLDLLVEVEFAGAAGRDADVRALLLAALDKADKAKFGRFAAEVRTRLLATKCTQDEAGKLDSAILRFHTMRGDNLHEARALVLGAHHPAISRTADERREDLARALKLARRTDDYKLQQSILYALAGAGPAEVADSYRKQAQSLKPAILRVLREKMRAALEHERAPTGAQMREFEFVLAVNFYDDDECRQYFKALQARAADPEHSDADRSKFLEAFKKSIAKGGSHGFYALVIAERTRRTEVLPFLEETVIADPKLPGFAVTIETLASHADLAALIKMLAVKNPFVVEHAAAALARVAEKDDIEAVRKALEATKDPTAAIYLDLLLARFGDKDALERLKKTAAGDKEELAVHACGVLGQLGFKAPERRMTELFDNTDVPPATIARVLGRAPRGWGASVLYQLQGFDTYSAARALARRGEPGRFEGLADEKRADALTWLLPITPEEARDAGMGGVCGYGLAFTAEGAMRDFFAWGAEAAGLGLPGVSDELRKKKDDPFAALALTELEQKQAGVVGGPQFLTLADLDDSGRALCRISVYPLMGDLVDNVIRAPFVFKHGIECEGDGLAGAIYSGLTVQIGAGDTLDSAAINIPGLPAIAATLTTAPGGKVSVSAELPVEVMGEGLGGLKTIDIEKLAKGTVTLKFKFMDNKGSLTFPLALLIPPQRNKPDLVAEEIIIEPAVPEQGKEAMITLRARNMGKAIEKGVVANARFTIKNPQAGGGYRTLGAVIFDTSGWRPGEWREFKARPKFVKDYYMNRYSHTWTLEMGDTEVSATIDADGAQEEDNEKNNTTSVQVPLALGEAEGSKLAEAEMIAQLQPLLAKVADAKTTEDAYMAIGLMRGLLQRAKTMTPEIEVARRHIESAVEMRVFALRTAALIKSYETAKAEGKLTRPALARIANELCAAKADLLKTGAPVQLDTLNKVRNSVMTAANATKALDQLYDDVGPLFGDHGATDLKNVTETLGKIDSVLLLARYARDHAAKGEADSADVLEAAGGLIPGQYAPGLSKMHQAMLDAEIKYVDKGFRKEAAALDALGDLIEGKEGAQERLDAAVKDVGDHVNAGPFNKDSLKEIAKGWAKDLPFIGPVLDTIWSWKTKPD
ncbi:MAG: hypothetical protein IT462_09740 [Planctomycetes bacterium]|nr:hypothetical protein [Planctomycetota bacterium]